ncbi:hypothetical protein GCM10009841_10880 [Microlunatus panaciterrae]|uniref:Phage shock protein PspC (Stress-responsive transcriptional regulator) n=1 Tax=Microlunatus panaciterrae TaxID=400768 RepID=A0ABS2RKV7_9ACTN|nr:PspC domain-containing protein [Microlunatus panaciterrae]MBM7799646.1 phage shock protein PspC (stress-responsive transcriptional regulator) [Microlunatus panaciterrae]
MTNPYPPPPYQAPKRLERSKTNKVLGGVCGGVAKYLNMDPTLVRVLTVVLSLFTGVPIIAYIVALFVIPEEGSAPPPHYPPVNPPQQGFQPYQPQGYQPAGQGYGDQASPAQASTPGEYGSQPQPSSDEAVWGAEGAPWEQRSGEPAAQPPTHSGPDATAQWGQQSAASQGPSTEPVAPEQESATASPAAPAEEGATPGDSSSSTGEGTAEDVRGDGQPPRV